MYRDYSPPAAIAGFTACLPHSLLSLIVNKGHKSSKILKKKKLENLTSHADWSQLILNSLADIDVNSRANAHWHCVSGSQWVDEWHLPEPFEELTVNVENYNIDSYRNDFYAVTNNNGWPHVCVYWQWYHVHQSFPVLLCETRCTSYNLVFLRRQTRKHLITQVFPTALRCESPRKPFRFSFNVHRKKKSVAP